MKKISPEQISAILHTVYNTNIPASTFDELKKFFSSLPDIEKKPVPQVKKP